MPFSEIEHAGGNPVMHDVMWLEARMRRILCDQFEFEPPDSEQSLELAVTAPSRHCPDLSSLLLECGASNNQGAPPQVNWPRWHSVVQHVAQFANVALPKPNELREAVLLQDNWDEVEVGFAFDSVLIWYHWSTSA